ncbi:oocyte-secreted protein 3-like [Peromyscus maniculatus bairdii]|uniref:oocyte-secreted protein 3-like n=1 Tax=Peromyscus maniculatus bairdii TaxID=230844 RepID=UPI003FD36CFE
MKTFITSGLLLLLLLLLLLTSWRCSGQEPVLLSTVSVECNYLHLRVIAKRTLFYPDVRVGPDELFLGTGCVVIHVRPDELEFNYPINLCGIVAEIVADGTIFYTWLTYKPKQLYFSAELQLQCVVHRSSCAMNNQEMLLPAAQYWFRSQLRYCNCCGYAHLLDNWVRTLTRVKT